jgi:hypothetical protein
MAAAAISSSWRDVGVSLRPAASQDAQFVRFLELRLAAPPMSSFRANAFTDLSGPVSMLSDWPYFVRAASCTFSKILIT